MSILDEIGVEEATPGAVPPAFDESAFQSWYKTWADKLKLAPNPDDPQHFYDYRAAFQAGVEPTIKSNWHWPSQFKKEGHPHLVLNGVNTKTGKSVGSDPVEDLLTESAVAVPVTPKPQFVKPDYWNEQLKPSLLETGKQIFEIPMSLGEVATTAGTGSLGWLVGSLRSIAEGTKPGSTRESVKAALADSLERLTYQPRTEPAKILMEKVGKGIEALTGPAGEAAAVVGES